MTLERVKIRGKYSIKPPITYFMGVVTQIKLAKVEFWEAEQ